jgi:hypothetical protein
LDGITQVHRRWKVTPKAILTPAAIEDFIDTGVAVCFERIEEANEKGIWMTATCRAEYRQEYDIDSDKGIGGSAHVNPAGSSVTVIDGAAEAKAKIGVEKSREGYAWVSREMEFRSKAANSQPAP